MDFKWLNEGSINQTKDRIEIIAPPQTDFFCGSIDECEESNAVEKAYSPSHFVMLLIIIRR